MISIFRPEQPYGSNQDQFNAHVYRFLRELGVAAQTKPVATKTAAYSAAPFELVPCDPTAGGFTVTLPNTTGNFGTRVWIKEHGGSTNTITVVGKDGKNIDGAASYAMSTARAWRAFVCIGSEWIVEGI